MRLSLRDLQHAESLLILVTHGAASEWLLLIFSHAQRPHLHTRGKNVLIRDLWEGKSCSDLFSSENIT